MHSSYLEEAMPSKKAKPISPEISPNSQLESKIRATAQKLYEERRAQNAEGDELSDWLAAEELVRAKRGRD